MKFLSKVRLFHKNTCFLNQILTFIPYIKNIRRTHQVGTALSATSWRQTRVQPLWLGSLNPSRPKQVRWLTYTKTLYTFITWFKNLLQPAINSLLTVNAGCVVCCFVVVEVGAALARIPNMGVPSRRRVECPNSNSSPNRSFFCPLSCYSKVATFYLHAPLNLSVLHDARL